MVKVKALILAAGFGTRLKPYSEATPKPLFPIAGQPNLDILIRNLVNAGCDEVLINTHHLHQSIDRFLSSQKYAIPVRVKYEPQILGTGGAIKNLETFWNSGPFFVINSDIVTDIDFKSVYGFHLQHSHPVTLVIYDDTEFNTLLIDQNDFVVDFYAHNSPLNHHNKKQATFTGIQVLDPSVLEFIPKNEFSSSIEAYEKMIQKGLKIKTFRPKKAYWKDFGTPERYQQAVYDKMVPMAFREAFSSGAKENIEQIRLKGDGSDRKWYRLKASNQSLIMANHGIRPKTANCEIDAFVSIGRHLYKKKIPVPKIYLYDLFSGLVFLEDLGDTHLQKVVQETNAPDTIINIYQSVIDQLVTLSITGAADFDTSWTYQTTHYDRSFIIENECRYFTDAFLNTYLGMDDHFDDLQEEFQSLASSALQFALNGFMHRDMQSRNIMIKNSRYHFIDFQGGRIGPLQYDLASLLIDPYVELPRQIQSHLLDYCFDRVKQFRRMEKEQFLSSYNACAITRNLQILGAFGFLSRQKGKLDFEKYIPYAIKTLKYNLSRVMDLEFPKLRPIVEKIIIGEGL